MGTDGRRWKGRGPGLGNVFRYTVYLHGYGLMNPAQRSIYREGIQSSREEI